jgi:hypothetical protein
VKYQARNSNDIGGIGRQWINVFHKVTDKAVWATAPKDLTPLPPSCPSAISGLQVRSREPHGLLRDEDGTESSLTIATQKVLDRNNKTTALIQEAAGEHIGYRIHLRMQKASATNKAKIIV